MKNKYFWNSECSKAVALKRKARRKYEKHINLTNRANYNKQSDLTKKEIKKQKRLSWITFKNFLTHSSSLLRFGKFFAKWKVNQFFYFKYHIEKNNTLLVNNNEIANKYLLSKFI